MKRIFTAFLCLVSTSFAAHPFPFFFWRPVYTAPSTGLAVVTSAKGFTGSTSTTISISPTAGNLLVVSLMGGGATDTTNHAISDNINSTTGWTKVASSTLESAVGECSMWYLKNCPAGITTITATSGSGSGATLGIAYEVSGASTSAPWTSGEQANAQPTSTTNPQTGSVTNATAASIFFAFAALSDGTNPGSIALNGTGTVGTWALQNTTNSQNLNGATQWIASMPYYIATTSASTKHGWTTVSASAVTVIAAFH